MGTAGRQGGEGEGGRVTALGNLLFSKERNVRKKTGAQSNSRFQLSCPRWMSISTRQGKISHGAQSSGAIK